MSEAAEIEAQSVADVEIRHADGTSQVVTVSKHRLIVGRSKMADVVLDDADVSRQHAELLLDVSGQHRVRDLGSKFGITVNGKKIESSPFTTADVLSVGLFTLRVRMRESKGPRVQETGDAAAMEFSLCEPQTTARISSVHLLQLNEFGNTLVRTADPKERMRSVCRLLVTPDYQALGAVVLRISKVDPALPPRPLCEPVGAAGSEWTPYVSRGLIAAVRKAEAPVVASVSPSHEAAIQLSMLPDAKQGRAAIACPIRVDDESIDLIYTGFSQAFATAEWTALVTLVCQQYRHAEATIDYMAERAERSRITQRFRSYVDPALVDYIVAHPELPIFEGQMFEVSIVFTDLAGFTTIVEKMGTGIVPLLSEYRAMAVPIIREHGGCISSFMGDGIMFFFGAPRNDPDHAYHALCTVMKMQEAQQKFNETLIPRGLPPLTTRAGITTGMVIAGDVGPPEASDYNVVGDDVNLAARLESANKAVGTVVMISENTAEKVKDRVLLRPVGRLRVVGKTKGVMVYEPLAFIESATDEQRELAAECRKLVDRYAAADFTGCLAQAEAIDKRFGESKLTKLYRAACAHYLDDVHQHFDGTIVLQEK